MLSKVGKLCDSVCTAAQLSVDRQKEMSDIKSMVNTLIMGMKSLLYSLSSHGNTAVVQPSAIAPGVVLPPSFGLREDEIEVRVPQQRFDIVDAASFRLRCVRGFGVTLQTLCCAVIFRTGSGQAGSAVAALPIWSDCLCAPTSSMKIHPAFADWQLAVGLVTKGLPCLRLFSDDKEEIKVYEMFADAFMPMQVPISLSLLY